MRSRCTQLQILRCVSWHSVWTEQIRSLPNDNKISDNKIRKISKFYCRGISQEMVFLENFLSIFPLPNPLQNANFINIIVSASLTNGRGGFGSQTAADPSGQPANPWKPHLGYSDSISQNAHPASALHFRVFFKFRAPKKGPENWCRAKNCRKVPKNFLTLFLTIFDIFCPALKLSKSVEKHFDTFWRFLMFFDVAPFRRPLLQSTYKWTFEFSAGTAKRGCLGRGKGLWGGLLVPQNGCVHFKNLWMPLFLMGCFPVDFKR